MTSFFNNAIPTFHQAPSILTRNYHIHITAPYQHNANLTSTHDTSHTIAMTSTEHTNAVSSLAGETVNGKFLLKEVIAIGKYATVYEAKDDTDRSFTIKMSHSTSVAPLRDEPSIYYQLTQNRKSGFPALYLKGKYKQRQYLVLDPLGETLARKLEKYPHGFSRKTVFMLAIRLITYVESLHSLGYVHRNIRPENILVGCKKCNEHNDVYLIGFVNAAKFRTQLGYHFPEKKVLHHGELSRPFMATAMHRRPQMSRKDDLESIVFVLIFLFRKTLPWISRAPSMGTDSLDAQSLKQDLSIAQICALTPDVLSQFHSEVRKMRFSSRPNYRKMRRMFVDALNEIEDEDDSKFDWMN